MLKKKEFKETPIGYLPKRWEVVKLGEISENIYYGITAKATEKDTGLKMLRTTDVKDYNVEWNDLPFCEVTEKRNDLSKYFLKSNDLIIARAGTTGVSVLVDRNLENVVFGSYLIKVKLKNVVHPEFVHYFLQSDFYWKHITSSQAGSTLKNINLPILKSLKIPLPPLPEQRRIAEILSTVDDAIQRVDETIAKTERLKRGLMRELLTKGVIVGFMFDTTIFGDILDNKIDVEKFPKNYQYYVTHVQNDEILKTPNEIVQKKLLSIFQGISKKEISTESAVVDVSKLDKAKLGNGVLLEAIRKGNLEFTKDALIGETAIKNSLILVTDDKKLLNAIRELGGWAITLEDFLSKKYRKFKDTEIGKIPKDWGVVKIKDVAETSSGGTPDRSKKEYYSGNIPWVKSGELKDNSVYDTEEKITEKGLQNSSAKLFPKGTLLVAMYGATVGKTGILAIDATTNQAICAILSQKDMFDPNYLKYFVIFRRNQLISISSGGAQPNISQEIIKLLKIPLPPLPEQRKIAEILSTVDKKLELERKRKGKLEKIKEGLMNDLLTGKKRTRLEVKV